MKIRLLVICLVVFAQVGYCGVTAEQILGEYWKDPLFGKAASDQTVRLEVLYGRIWPESFSVKVGAKVRVLVENKTNEAHMLVFTQNIDDLRQSKEFSAFISDEIYHDKQKNQRSSAHSHSHGEASADDAQSIVKNISQNPSVFVSNGDTKEVLIAFDKPGEVMYTCMIDDHSGEKTIGKVIIE